MSKQYGIEAHLQHFYSSTQGKLPSQSTLTHVKELRSIINKKLQYLSSVQENQLLIEDTMSREEMEKLIENRKTKEKNDKIIRVLQVKRQMESYVEKFIQSQSIEIFQDKLQRKNKCFSEIYLLVSSFDDQLNLILHDEPQSLAVKKKHMKNLNTYFCRKILNQEKNDKIQLHLKTIFQTLGLPLKKGKKVNGQNINVESLEFMTEQLFNEYCYFCLSKKIQMLTEDEDPQKKESIFFKTFWHKIFKSVIYIFLNPTNKVNETSAYQIDEPNWMFQYVQQVFQLNSECLQKFVEEVHVSEAILNAIKIYILHYNVDNYFLLNISKRLETDLQQLSNMSKSEEKNNVKFIVFNFLDELYTYQENLSSKYMIELNFVEEVLLKYNETSLFQYRLLDLNFDYEHYWIEDQIFSEFYDYNYSNVSNLKNVEAFNITLSYIQLFDKLYAKFQKIKNEKLKYEINTFYQDSILNFVRHLKTSFQRIYKNNKLSKYQIILSYKRVEEEFKNYFIGFIQGSPSFQQKIKQEYFSSLTQTTNVYALEELNQIHSKLIKRLTKLDEFFTTGSSKNVDELRIKMKNLYNDWIEKIEKINKIQVYADPKLKNIFFNYLQTTPFVSEGYQVFISIFEPYLKQIYTAEGMRMVRMLIEMDKATLKEYVSSHQQTVSFLSSSELKSIERCKIK